jgi:hypothetical protein
MRENEDSLPSTTDDGATLPNHEVVEEGGVSGRSSLEVATAFFSDPTVQIAIRDLGERVQGYAQSFVKAAVPIIRQWRDVSKKLAPVLQRLAKELPALIERARLPNWQMIDLPDQGLLEQMLIEEGLALAWVPPHATLQKLISAPSAAARRRIIGTTWKATTQACVVELHKVDATRLQSDRRFALESAQALLDGHSSASQALSANLLDSSLRANLDSVTLRTITGQRERLDYEQQYTLRAAITWGGVHGAYGQYWPDKGDSIPRHFRRHGSAHGVSRRQYSRINAVIALMHVTAVLRLLDSTPTALRQTTHKATVPKEKP